MEHIFSKWPTVAALARDLGKPYPTVAAWAQRKSIPAKYDMALIALATARGEVLTIEEIARARSHDAERATQ